MSIEAMKQVIELYDKHCYNNDYGGIEFSNKHGYKFIEAIEALRTAIQQAESDPVHALLDNANPLLVFAIESEIGVYQEHEIPTAARNAIKASKTYNHPATGVQDDVVRDAERYRWLRATTNWASSNGERIDVRNNPELWDSAIDAAMLAASPAQKGGAA